MENHIDSFCLLIEDELFSYLEVKTVSVENKDYDVFLDGISIGKLWADFGKYNFYGLHPEGRSLILLLPTQALKNGCGISDAMFFVEILTRFLKQRSGWAIACERDIDGEEVAHLTYDLFKMESLVSHAALYWKGILQTCPAFFMRSGM